MRKASFATRALPALIGLAFSGVASAAGFALLEQNASGIGNSYAGSAAVAENASTIFFNPAGMTRLQDREISVGVSAVRPSFKFTNNGTLNPTFLGGGPATGSNGGDAGDWAAIPNGFLSWALSKDLYLGVGLSAPFGLATEYDPDWVGRFQAIKFEIKTYNLNPSIAYRVNDKVSLGFGLNWQRLEAEYVRQATPAAQVKLEADDDAWGWNLGALFQVSPSTRIGVSYRSAIEYELDGNFSGAVNAGAKADLEVPDMFILSVSQALNDRWEMLGDISWTGWSSVDRVNILLKATGATAQTLDARFDDTWRVALGGTYKYSDTMKIKFGVAYDQTPVPNDQFRLTSLPDNDRYWISGGIQWKPAKNSALDLGVAYLFVKDTNIDNDQNTGLPVPQRGIVRGSYDSDVWILGAQYSMSF